MIKINSSNIEEVSYDYSECKLYIKFKSGRIYEYKDVPFQIFKGLINTNSAGVYFNRFIRNAYDYRLVDQVPVVQENVKEGEIILRVKRKRDEKTITIFLEKHPEMGEFSIRETAPESEQNDFIPYWFLLKVKSSILLLEKLRDFFKDNRGVDETRLAWDGSNLRLIVEDFHIEKTKDEEEKELKRQRRIEIAKKRFGAM